MTAFQGSHLDFAPVAKVRNPPTINVRLVLHKNRLIARSPERTPRMMWLAPGMDELEVQREVYPASGPVEAGVSEFDQRSGTNRDRPPFQP